MNRLAVIGIVTIVAFGPRADPRRQGDQAIERIALNDNRSPAARPSGSVLTVRLDARTGRWFPDGDARPGLLVNAFAVTDGPLQIPGPLLRVPEGTTIRATVRNGLDVPLVMHGLYSRADPNVDTATVAIPAGDTHTFTFAAGRPGTYYYWGTTRSEDQIQDRAGADSQLSGAFVVDPRDAADAADRVLVIAGWSNARSAAVPPAPQAARFRWVINGLSWPGTERLSYRAGDAVRLRVVNVSSGVHPMHLHGFYFNVDSRGDEREDVATGSAPHLVVTERLVPGRTFALTWKPTRPGNWLFHCHDSAHIDYGGPIDSDAPPQADVHRHVQNHALEMMAGPVMGITVTGNSLEPADTASKRRQLRIVARVDADSTDAEPAYGYTLGEADPSSTSIPRYLPAPTIVLKRGEPVSITVANELPEATAVHWHGIELESFFDGVPGFAGSGSQIAPAIPPHGSFEARFTPRRSGTFIYHAHVDDRRQQQSGLAGPLIVVDSLESYDAAHDIVLMVTTPRKNADRGVVLINGSLNPPPVEFHVGQTYRLRFINLHSFRPSMRMRFVRGDSLLTWRSWAKDGMDLAPDQMLDRPAEIQMGNGETYDFAFTPTDRGEIRFEVRSAPGVLLATMPIHVS